MCAIFQEKQKNLAFSSKICQKKILGSEFQKSKSGFGISPPRYQVCQFSAKTDNFEFFGLNLGKFPNYVQYFGSNYVDGVGESWLEADVNWMEVDGAGWRLKLAEWRWMDLGGEGWR